MAGADPGQAGMNGGELPSGGLPGRRQCRRLPGWSGSRRRRRWSRARLEPQRHPYAGPDAAHNGQPSPRDEDDNGLRSRTISNTRLAEFHGGRSVTSYEYNQWKMYVAVAKEVYQLSNTEIALLIYTQVRGEANHLLQILEIEDLRHRKPSTLSGIFWMRRTTGGAREDI